MGPISLLSKLIAFTAVLRCGWESKNYHGLLPQILGNKEKYLKHFKVEKILKGSLDLIQSPSPSINFH
jgi:hypothetical protein